MKLFIYINRFKRLPGKLRWIFISNTFYKYINRIILKKDYYALERKNNLVATSVNGLNLNVNIRFPSSDVGVFDQVFCFKEYESVTDILAKYFSATEKIKIIDGGANVGYTTLFLKSYFPNAEILCVEPDENNAQMIRKNISLNHLSDVDILVAGVWKSKGFLSINEDFRDGSECALQVEEDLNESSGLEAYRLSDLMKVMSWEKLDFLKLDIEGAEHQVFEERTEILSFLINVSCIAIEIHDELANRDNIESILLESGFVVSHSGELTIGVRDE